MQTGNGHQEIPYRALGRTGEKVSAIGVGGYHLGQLKGEKEAVRIIRAAIDRGINFLDNSWDYHEGTDHVDLMQFHKDPHVHLYMLEVAARHRFVFDTVQIPLNVMDAHFRSFAQHVLPVLVKNKIGVLGMKSMGSGVILRSKAVTAIECLHYAMNLPTSVVITGIDSMEILEQAIEAATTFRPMSAEEIRNLLAKTAPVAGSGKFELFKTTSHNDSTAENPEWLGGDPKEAEELAKLVES